MDILIALSKASREFSGYHFSYKKLQETVQLRPNQGGNEMTLNFFNGITPDGHLKQQKPRTLSPPPPPQAVINLRVLKSPKHLPSSSLLRSLRTFGNSRNGAVIYRIWIK